MTGIRKNRKTKNIFLKKTTFKKNNTLTKTDYSEKIDT